MWKNTARWVLACGVAMAVAACGGGDSTPATSVTAEIGPLGGTVTGPDGVQVVVPAGALEQLTTIGIARSAVGAPTPLPTDNPPAGPVYEFTPHGQVFKKPVTLRMPVPAGAAGGEVFMASPGEDWQVNGAVVTAGVAEWLRNSFSWGMLGLACAIPANNTDPYPCVYPRGYATASATPSSSLTQIASPTNSGSAGSWTVNQAGVVNLTLHYEAAPDCGNGGAAPAGQVKLIRWNPAVLPRVVQTVFDGPAALTVTTVTVPAGVLSSGTGGPAQRGMGSMTIDVSAFLTDPVNAFGFSFACNRPGRSVSRGGDLLTFIGAMPAPIGPHTIGGTISGLTGTGLVLQNNGGDNLSAAPNAGTFSFATPVSNGSGYSVSVATQPAGQSCTVQSGAGIATAAVSNVAISCVNTGPAPMVATSLATGFGSSLVVASDGTVWAWGQLTDPTTGGYKSASPWASTPVKVQGLAGVKAVSLSAEASSYYALHSDGTVSAWGLNTNGQLGDRTVATRALPVKVMQDATTPMGDVCSISAGANILVMTRQSGSQGNCSGSNAVAWIVGWFISSPGLGGETSSPSPTNGAIAKPVPGLPAGVGVKQVISPHAANARGGVLFQLDDNTWWAWGDNRNSALGTNNVLGAGISTPFAGGVGGAVQVNSFWLGTSRAEIGLNFALALQSNVLKGVGGNGGNPVSSNVLLPIAGLTNVSAFSAGQNSAAAVMAGELWQWGWNGNTYVVTPTRVGTLTGFTQVSVGDLHSLAIGTNGELYSWGDSSFGALGRTGSSSIPGVVMRP